MFFRRAFTLIELLIVISIIGLLVAILLPAVQRARESANRIQCTNNLKQMGIAVHAYHDTNSMLPPSRIADHWAPWSILILPFMDQQSYYSKWDVTAEYYNQPSPVQSNSFGFMYCPSRRRGPQLSTESSMANSPAVKGACADYAGVCGSLSFYTNPPAVYFPWMDNPNANGVFVMAVPTGAIPDTNTLIPTFHSMLRFNDVTDGLSNTVMIGEKNVPKSMFTVSYGDGSFWNGDNEWNFCRIMGPGFQMSSTINDLTLWQWNFGSWHTGVCQFVMCDGSVRAINVTTDVAVQQQLAERADGQATNQQ